MELLLLSLLIAAAATLYVMLISRAVPSCHFFLWWH